MKNKIALGSVLSLIMMSSSLVNAAAIPASVMPSGTLNITGKIIDKGCTMEVKDFIVQLAPVVVSKFTAAGDTGPKSDPVDFKLTGCPANTNLNLTVQGTAGALRTFFATTPSTPGSLYAKGFDFVLFGPTETSVISPNVTKIITPDASGNVSGMLVAQLRSNVAVPTPGKIDTTLTYTLVYN